MHKANLVFPCFLRRRLSYEVVEVDSDVRLELDEKR
jgi:hypothetical protein